MSASNTSLLVPHMHAGRLRAPDVTEKLRSAGAEVVASTPDVFSAFIKAETAKWANVAKIAGIQPE